MSRYAKGMNGDTMLNVEECAKEAGALRECEMCGQLVSADDPDAEARAYAVVTNAWKGDRRGFRAMERKEVVELMHRTLRRFGYCSCSAPIFDH